MILYTAYINECPITKKNHMRILRMGNGRTIVAPSKEYKEYEEIALWKLPHISKTISEPCNIKCVFHMPTRRRCDLVNHLESILDILVKKGIIADDNYEIAVSYDGSRVVYDKGNPGTEITITRENKIEQKGEDKNGQ